MVFVLKSPEQVRNKSKGPEILFAHRMEGGERAHLGDSTMDTVRGLLGRASLNTSTPHGENVIERVIIDSLALEAAFGIPLDVEFVISPDEEHFFTQFRPALI